jgi:hypothetical protein
VRKDELLRNPPMMRAALLLTVGVIIVRSCLLGSATVFVLLAS